MAHVWATFIPLAQWQMQTVASLPEFAFKKTDKFLFVHFLWKKNSMYISEGHALGIFRALKTLET